MHQPPSRDAAFPGPKQDRRAAAAAPDREANPVWDYLALRPAIVSGVGERVQFQSDSGQPSDAPAQIGVAPYGVIVDDGADVREGQVTRSEFLAGLAPALEAIANTELASMGLTAAGCQYIPYWLGYYSEKSAAHVERAIARFADPQDTTPGGLRAAVVQRVRRAVQEWVQSGGDVVDVPAGLDTLVSDDGLSEPEAGTAEPMAKFADGSGGVISASDPAAVRARLGDGRPFDGTVRTQMERGFGESFADVRLHTDNGAAGMASGFSARAFTVGSDVAFAPGEYRPGTLAGNALIAHELAHVVQQRGGGRAAGPASNDLEQNADLAAAAVIGQTNDDLELDPDIFAMPQLSRGGLRLQRCSTSNPPAVDPDLLKNAPLTTMTETQLLDRFDKLVAAERALRVWLQNHSSATADRQVATLVDQAELLAQHFAGLHVAASGESQRTFSPQAVARMKKYFIANVAKGSAALACINTVRAGLGELYDSSAAGTPASVTSGLKMTPRNTMEETMEQMRKKGLASQAKELHFADSSGKQINRGSPARPVKLVTSVWDTIISTVGSDSNYSVFGLSLMNGYHSVTLTVDSRIPGRPRIYWSDQTSRHDIGFEEYQKGASGHVKVFESGSPRGLDEYIEYAVPFWWDDELKTNGVKMYSVVRLWRLNQPPPPKPKPKPKPTPKPKPRRR
jgi:hypothetical protein